jgi:hypothetical protein
MSLKADQGQAGVTPFSGCNPETRPVIPAVA